MEKDILGNAAQKQTGMAILISNKTDFKTKLVRKNKVGHFILIKGIIHQEDITIAYISALDIGTPKCINITGHKNIDRPQHNSSG
jgi:hypothetical protein